MKKRLRGVAHNFAHHCQSGLSFIQPHLSAALSRAGVSLLEVDLLPTVDTRPRIDADGPLSKALQSARVRLMDILAKHRIDELHIASVRVVFRVRRISDYDSAVEVRMRTTTGEEVVEGVTFIIDDPHGPKSGV